MSRLMISGADRCNYLLIFSEILAGRGPLWALPAALSIIFRHAVSKPRSEPTSARLRQNGRHSTPLKGGIFDGGIYYALWCSLNVRSGTEIKRITPHLV